MVVFMVILTLCVTAAGAASLSNNLVVSRVTQTFQIATTTAPVYATCPSGYTCLTDADATALFGTYARYSDAVCGYHQNTGVLAAVVREPEYCVKQTSAPVQTTCPTGCSCMPESVAKDKFQGVYIQCSEKPCATVVTGAAQVNAYCFGAGSTTTTTPSGTCKAGCSCISEATATAKGGTWTRCSEEICGYEQSSATLAAVVRVPKYCMQQETTPVCPEGCACISDEDAKLKGLTERCNASQTPCGYRSVDATATTAATRIPLYCYATPLTTTPVPQVCPQGCFCLQEAEAKDKFGPNNYTRCQADICGYDPSATTANGIPKYCFKPAVTVTVTPTPAVCPQGCLCTTDETAKEKGLTVCRGTRTSCGHDEKNQTLYCFEQVPSPTCVYDYQKNACSGTCDQGYACGLLASEKDAAGQVTYGVCGCTGQPATACAYDPQKNACTGTCRSGAACSVVGRNVDEKTGAATPVCGCPQQGSCSYNYDRDACVGNCTVTGEACQLNTIYRNATTGKVTYAECHCKAGGNITAACACDAASGSCTGTCTGGKACTMTERTTDAAGAVTCKSCGCTDSCVLDADNRCWGTCPDGGQCSGITTKDNSGQEIVSCGCTGSPAGTGGGAGTSPQSILSAIGSFFNRLFGGK
jgi:hypothetical protein